MNISMILLPLVVFLISSTDAAAFRKSELPECEEVGQLIANPDDCASFYECSADGPKLLHCPAGLEYNEGTQRCEAPEEADCHRGNHTDRPPTREPTKRPTDRPTESPTKVTTAGPTESPTKAPTEGPTKKPTPPPVTCSEIGQLIANPNDCGSFYECSVEGPQLMYCPAGLEYNEVTQRCEAPEEADCHRGNHTDRPPTEEPTKRPTEIPTEATTARPTDQPTPPPVTCSEIGQLIANPNDCGSFYECSVEGPQLMYCPAGLEYNEVTQRCEAPEDADCHRGNHTDRPPTKSPTDAPTEIPTNPTTEGTTNVQTSRPTRQPTSPTQGPDPSKCHHVGDLLPNPTDCHTFYECTLNGPILVTCPKGSDFNPIEKTCDLPENANCAANICTVIGDLEPNPVDCESYYECTPDGPVLLPCPPYLEFNPVYKVCEDPATAGCTWI